MFPVGRIGRYMRDRKWSKSNRVSADAPVYLAATMEFLCAEILEIAGQSCEENKKRLITPRHIELSVRKDPEFVWLFKNKTFSGGGKAPQAIIMEKVIKNN